MLLPRSWVTLTSALTSAPEGSRVPMGARRAVPAAKASGRYRFGFTQREPKYQFAADSALEGDGFEPAVLSPCWGSSTIASPARPAIGRSYRAGWANNSFFRSEPGAAELRRLARHESGRVCQRVLMIANLLEGMEHEEAARLAGLSRSAAYEWHNRYEEEGIAGLRDRLRAGRQPRVDAVTSARLKERIVAGAELERDGVVAFRGVDAQRILKEEFDVDCSLSSTYRLLHRIQLSWLAPRPRHPQADATAQAAFSQLLDCN